MPSIRGPNWRVFFSLQHPGLPELIGPLLSAEGVASRCLQWRLHRELIAGFSSLVLCLTSDQLYNKIVPVLIRNITGKVCIYTYRRTIISYPVNGCLSACQGCSSGETRLQSFTGGHHSKSQKIGATNSNL